MKEFRAGVPLKVGMKVVDAGDPDPFVVGDVIAIQAVGDGFKRIFVKWPTGQLGDYWPPQLWAVVDDDEPKRS